jgi:hypothetical protein
MLTPLSIKSLYVPALAEGEGVGTAYEYFAKRLVLSPWLAQMTPKPRTMLIAGLPQKYGSSLDFVLLAAELNTAVTIIDDRPEALEKAQQALTAAQALGWLPNFSGATYQLVDSLTALDLGSQRFDLAIASEVLQRLPQNGRSAYIRALHSHASAVALFAPNADNPAHTNLSGLAGLRLDELQALASANAQTGYIDMPPFPPGIVRSEDQREQATSGLAEGVAMMGLAYYARLEHGLPTAVRRKQSHIVYALSPR